MEGLHLFHADVIRIAELNFMHGYGWVEVDIVSKRSGLEREGHTLLG